MSEVRQRIVNTCVATVQAVPLLLPIGLAAFSAICMILLLTGTFYTWALLAFGLPAAALAIWVARDMPRSYTRPGRPRSQLSVDFLALGLIIIWGAVNLPLAAQHILTDRDPATYTVTAALLTRQHSLALPKPVGFSGLPTVLADSLGFGTSELHANQLYAQGSHLLPALLGVVGKVAGIHAIFYGNVLFGAIALLAFYGFARLIMRPYWALAAVAVLGSCLPFLSFTRDSYTEPLSLLFVFSTLSLLGIARRRDDKYSWGIAGLAAGAIALVRPDAYVSIAALLVCLAIWIIATPSSARVQRLAQAGAFVLPITLLTLLGWLDLTRLSSGYYHDLRFQIMAQIICILWIVVLAIPAIITCWRWQMTEKVRRLITHPRTGNICVALLCLGFGLLLLRALWLFGMATLGKEETLNVQIYSDHTTMLWLCWYLGPLLALIGVGMFIHSWKRLLAGTASLLLPFLCILSADCVLYLLYPHISPDQVWASRRFLPVIFPGFILFGMLGLQAIWPLRSRLPAPLRPFLVLASILALVLPALPSMPFIHTHAFAEASQITNICQTVRPQSVVAWVGDAGAFTTEPTTAFCHATSFSLTATTQLPELQRIAAAQHSSLYLGAFDTQTNLLPYSGPLYRLPTLTYVEPEHTYKKFPLHTISHMQTIVLKRIPT